MKAAAVGVVALFRRHCVTLTLTLRPVVLVAAVVVGPVEVAVTHHTLKYIRNLRLLPVAAFALLTMLSLRVVRTTKAFQLILVVCTGPFVVHFLDEISFLQQPMFSVKGFLNRTMFLVLLFFEKHICFQGFATKNSFHFSEIRHGASFGQQEKQYHCSKFARFALLYRQ